MREEFTRERLDAQVVRGVDCDLADARQFVSSGLLDPRKFRSLVEEIPESAYARYPNLSRTAVARAVAEFLDA